MGLTLSTYVVGAVAAALIAVLVATSKSAKKAAVDATGLSQTGQDGLTGATGQEGTTAGATAAELPKQPPSAPSAPKKPLDWGTKLCMDRAAVEAIVAKFDFTLDPDLENDLCGLPPMDDGNEWVPYVPPPPIRQSQLSDEDKATFREYIRLCFGEETLLGRRIIFDAHDIGALCEKVLPYLESEQILIEDVPLGVTVVGDIHGQLYDLHRVFQLAEKDGKPGWENMKYLFLGDYVDRGRQSYECLIVLFCLKMLHPDRIFLLRGNHEFDDQNGHYGFGGEISDRYDDATAKAVYKTFTEVFGYLSLAAIVGGDRYFCAHAGVSPVGMTRYRLNSIYKPILKADEHKFITDLTWCDPAPGLKGAVFNSDRGCGSLLGTDAVNVALSSVNARVLVRGHTVLQNGYEISMGGTCISIFSQSGASGENKAAVGVIGEDGYMDIVVLEFDKERDYLEKVQENLDCGGDGKVKGRRSEEKTKCEQDTLEA